MDAGVATALTVGDAQAIWVHENRFTRSSAVAARAVAATALTVAAAGAANRLASAGAAGGVAVAATALVVLPTLLVEGLTLVVGSSLTDT